MKCPHCLENFHDDKCWQIYGWIEDVDGYWRMQHCHCPSCKRIIIELHIGKLVRAGIVDHGGMFVRPKATSRTPLSPDVPREYSRDYNEACMVLSDSPKASGALSRRCLQLLLKDKGGAVKKDLADQIQEVLDSKQLPTYLTENIDAIRNIGNFAGHPIKSKCSGEIVDVEPGEAEWNLAVLEGLFDFYFVQPVLMRKRRESLNKKLAEYGKPSMK